MVKEYNSCFRQVNRQKEELSPLVTDIYLGQRHLVKMRNWFLQIYIKSFSAVVIYSDLIELWILISFHKSIMNKNVDECL